MFPAPRHLTNMVAFYTGMRTKIQYDTRLTLHRASPPSLGADMPSTPSISPRADSRQCTYMMRRHHGTVTQAHKPFWGVELVRCSTRSAAGTAASTSSRSERHPPGAVVSPSF